MKTIPPEYYVSCSRTEMDITVIHQYLSQEAYWCQGIPVETLERAMNGSLNFGVFTGGEQAAYARVVSDRATFAYLCDVFVLPQYRGRGLSKMLMEAVQSHPELQGLRRWMLMTRDAHGLYEQFGWTPCISSK
jgi:GNAT superfamily N-acetyltransferase